MNDESGGSYYGLIYSSVQIANLINLHFPMNFQKPVVLIQLGYQQS
jgi:hypothetical protein